MDALAPDLAYTDPGPYSDAFLQSLFTPAPVMADQTPDGDLPTTPADVLNAAVDLAASSTACRVRSLNKRGVIIGIDKSGTKVLVSLNESKNLVTGRIEPAKKVARRPEDIDLVALDGRPSTARRRKITRTHDRTTNVVSYDDPATDISKFRLLGPRARAEEDRDNQAIANDIVAGRGVQGRVVTKPGLPPNIKRKDVADPYRPGTAPSRGTAPLSSLAFTRERAPYYAIASQPPPPPSPQRGSLRDPDAPPPPPQPAYIDVSQIQPPEPPPYTPGSYSEAPSTVSPKRAARAASRRAESEAKLAAAQEQNETLSKQLLSLQKTVAELEKSKAAEIKSADDAVQQKVVASSKSVKALINSELLSKEDRRRLKKEYALQADHTKNLQTEKRGMEKRVAELERLLHAFAGKMGDGSAPPQDQDAAAADADAPPYSDGESVASGGGRAASTKVRPFGFQERDEKKRRDDLERAKALEARAFLEERAYEVAERARKARAAAVGPPPGLEARNREMQAKRRIKTAERLAAEAGHKPRRMLSDRELMEQDVAQQIAAAPATFKAKPVDKQMLQATGLKEKIAQDKALAQADKERTARRRQRVELQKAADRAKRDADDRERARPSVRPAEDPEAVLKAIEKQQAVWTKKMEDRKRQTEAGYAKTLAAPIAIQMQAKWASNTKRAAIRGAVSKGLATEAELEPLEIAEIKKLVGKRVIAQQKRQRSADIKRMAELRAQLEAERAETGDPKPTKQSARLEERSRVHGKFATTYADLTAQIDNARRNDRYKQVATLTQQLTALKAMGGTAADKALEAEIERKKNVDARLEEMKRKRRDKLAADAVSRKPSANAKRRLKGPFLHQGDGGAAAWATAALAARAGQTGGSGESAQAGVL